jgi:hypothetical protein
VSAGSSADGDGGRGAGWVPTVGNRGRAGHDDSGTRFRCCACESSLFVFDSSSPASDCFRKSWTASTTRLAAALRSAFLVVDRDFRRVRRLVGLGLLVLVKKERGELADIKFPCRYQVPLQILLASFEDACERSIFLLRNASFPHSTEDSG